MSHQARNSTGAVSTAVQRGPRVPVPRAAPGALRVEVFWPLPGIAVLKVAGDVDVATAAPLTRALDELTAHRPRVAVVDLTGVSFLGSAGLAALAGASERTDVRVVAPTRHTARPLSITGLDQRMPVYGSRDEALSSC
ncbi:STAS domain-containing protein [Amycolatopsis thermophila]|uniref:Anti-sigma factor antagonist n=1 Tax=Amycolatopsis thermophila TaxID=206084 RepID=A0ABU0F2U6_9PSEU|nr:STAS domain-containing protein [Amycolatopsis thermophila]MDQ0381904.1 anti-anti-sigma factor [Amycolatopsis thermophila]